MLSRCSKLESTLLFLLLSGSFRVRCLRTSSFLIDSVYSTIVKNLVDPSNAAGSPPDGPQRITMGKKTEAVVSPGEVGANTAATSVFA